MLTCATVIAVLIPLFLRAASNSLDLFEPIVPASVSLLTMFVARPIADQITQNHVALGYDISGTFDEALVVAFLGCLSITVGYLWGLGPLLKRIMPTFRDQMSPGGATTFAAICTVVGLGLFAVFLASNGGLSFLRVLLSGRSEQVSQAFRHTTGILYCAIYLLLPASFVLLMAWLKFRRKYLLTSGVVLGLLTLGYSAALGNRSDMLPTAVGAAAIFYLSRGTRPKLKNCVALCLLFLILSSALREFRDADSAASGKSFMDNPLESVMKTFTKNDDEMFDTIANILTVVPQQLPYQPLGLVTDLSSRVLPRSLYPDKPLEVTDQFIVKLWPWHYRLSRASAASSVFGEFYLYAGLAGVVLGNFLIGSLFSGVWRWYRANRTNSNVILLYAFVPALVVVLLRGTIPDTLTRMVYYFFPLLLGPAVWTRAAQRLTKGR